VYSSSFLRIQGIRGTYFSIQGECAESTLAYLENTPKKSMRTRRILAYSPNTPGDTKLRKPEVIMVQRECFLEPYFQCKMGWIKPKKQFEVTVPLNIK
jgi:hypothetical protein